MPSTIVYERTFYPDLDGSPLESGAVYIGEPGKDPEVFPVDCFWDQAMSIPATQPLTVTAGCIVNNGVRAQVFADVGAYSMRVRNRSGLQVDYIARATGTGEADVVTIEDYGGVGDGITDNAAAFALADVDVQSVLIPAGKTYYTSVLPAGKYFGEGTIKYGLESIRLYPLPHYVNSDVTAATPDAEDDEIAGSIRAFNLTVGMGAGFSLNPVNSTAWTVIGTRAGLNVTSMSRLTAIGYEACQNISDAGLPYSIVAVGASAASRSTYSMRNVFVGDNAGKWSGSNDPVGTLHDFFRVAWSADMQGIEARNPTARTDASIGPVTGPAGTVAASNADNARNVSIGRNAGIHSVKRRDSVSIGYRAAANQWDVQWNVDIGRNAGVDSLIGSFNTNIGGAAGRYNQLGNRNVNVGYIAGTAAPDGTYRTNISNTVAIGADARIQANNTGKVGEGLDALGISGRLSSKQTIASPATVGGMTLTATQICDNSGIQRGGTQAGNFSDTTDTAANILDRIPGYEAGQGFEFWIQNNTGFQQTLLGGTGVTLSGTMTIAAGSGRRFSLRCTSRADKTVTITNIGQFTI